MNDKLNGHLVIVIAIEHYNPLGQLRVMGERGIHPVFIALKYKVRMASASKYISKLYQVENEDEGFKILMENYGDVADKTGKKPILLFSDDKTVGYYDARYEELKHKFIFFNAGKNNRISKFMDKGEILECAKRHGVPVLPTVIVERGEIPADLKYPVITKAISPNAGAWKGDVNICYSEQELKEAMERIQSPQVLLQHYIEKKTEITLEGFSYNHGQGMFVGVECRYVYTIKGYYSPYHNTYPMKNMKLKAKLNAMLAEIGFEGIWEIEFLVDQDENLWFLEINFRNSTWGYASNVAGNPLPYNWSLAMLGEDIGAPKEFEPFMSMVEPIDYNKRVVEKRCSFGEWLSDFKNAKCTYYFNNEDMEPWRIVCDNWEKLG